MLTMESFHHHFSHCPMECCSISFGAPVGRSGGRASDPGGSSQQRNGRAIDAIGDGMFQVTGVFQGNMCRKSPFVG